MSALPQIRQSISSCLLGWMCSFAFVQHVNTRLEICECQTHVVINGVKHDHAQRNETQRRVAFRSWQ